MTGTGTDLLRRIRTALLIICAALTAWDGQMARTFLFCFLIAWLEWLDHTAPSRDRP